ncbi:hypothetical protein GOP47_0027631 [Adiantum capillus-veneris]|nr:hypothetical protein GOP47_0027631 [Adiantum capillus-veneris]
MQRHVLYRAATKSTQTWMKNINITWKMSPRPVDVINTDVYTPQHLKGGLVTGGRMHRNFSSIASPYEHLVIDRGHQKLYTNRLLGAIDNGQLVASQVSLKDLRRDLVLNWVEIDEAHGDAILHAEDSVHLGLFALNSLEGTKALSKLDKLEKILGVPYESSRLLVRLINEAGELSYRELQKEYLAEAQKKESVTKHENK